MICAPKIDEVIQVLNHEPYELPNTDYRFFFGQLTFGRFRLQMNYCAEKTPESYTRQALTQLWYGLPEQRYNGAELCKTMEKPEKYLKFIPHSDIVNVVPAEERRNMYNGEPIYKRSILLIHLNVGTYRCYDGGFTTDFEGIHGYFELLD